MGSSRANETARTEEQQNLRFEVCDTNTSQVARWQHSRSCQQRENVEKAYTQYPCWVNGTGVIQTYIKFICKKQQHKLMDRFL